MKMAEQFGREVGIAARHIAPQDKHRWGELCRLLGLEDGQ